MNELSSFTESEFFKAKNLLCVSLASDKISHDKPFAILTGGQPGSGKTTISRIYDDKTYGDFIFINGDDYRKLHPHFLDIYKQSNGDFHPYTNDFSHRMIQEVIEFGANNKFNMVIEGTLRTTSVPNSTRSFLQENGFNVSLAVMVVRPEISYLSTLKRFNQMLERGTSGRLTSKNDHDFIVDRIVDNLDILYKEKRFDNILLFDRDKKCLYNFLNSPSLNPSVILEKEFSRDLSLDEKHKIFNDFKNFVKPDIINSVLDDKFFLSKNVEIDFNDCFKNRNKNSVLEI